MTQRLNLSEPEIVRLYLGGWSVNRLAKRFECSRNVIDRRLIEAGIQPRGQSAANQLKWSQMTPAERQRQVAAAHEASRGSTTSLETKVKTARTRFRRQVGISPTEDLLADKLRRAGLHPLQQFPIGPYNCDLAVHPVAVEIWGGHWHWHGQHIAITEERTRYILGAGWHVYIMPVTATDPLTDARVADLVSFIHSASRDPTMRRQYRVVWRAGKWERIGYQEDDNITVEPPFTHRRNLTTRHYE